MEEALQIEIAVACPRCGSGKYHVCGGDGVVVYRECMAMVSRDGVLKPCGYRGKTHRMTQLELTRLLARQELAGVDVRVVSVEVRGGARD